MPVRGEIHLWVREDGTDDAPALPKAIAPGTRPPGPGSVVAVRAPRVKEARALLVQRSQILAKLGGEPSESDLELLERAGSPDVAVLRAVRVVPPSDLVRPYGSAS